MLTLETVVFHCFRLFPDLKELDITAIAPNGTAPGVFALKRFQTLEEEFNWIDYIRTRQERAKLIGDTVELHLKNLETSHLQDSCILRTTRQGVKAKDKIRPFKLQTTTQKGIINQ